MALHSQETCNGSMLSCLPNSLPPRTSAAHVSVHAGRSTASLHALTRPMFEQNNVRGRLQFSTSHQSSATAIPGAPSMRTISSALHPPACMQCRLLWKLLRSLTYLASCVSQVPAFPSIFRTKGFRAPVQQPGHWKEAYSLILQNVNTRVNRLSL